MLYQLSHVRVAWRTLTDPPEPSKQGGPRRVARRVPAASPQVSDPSGPPRRRTAVRAARRRGRAGRSRCRPARVPRSGGGSRRPRSRGQLEQRLARRRAQVQEEDVGRAVRRPQPHVALADGAGRARLQQLAAQQPRDPAVVDGRRGRSSSTAVAEGDAHRERVGWRRSRAAPAPRSTTGTDQLERDGGGVPGGPSARHVRSTTVGQEVTGMHFLHVRLTRHSDGSTHRAAAAAPATARPGEVVNRRGACDANDRM